MAYVCLPLGDLEVRLVAAGMEGQGWVAWREACTRVGKAKGAGRLLWARGDCSRAGQSRVVLGPPQFGSPLALGIRYTQRSVSTCREPEPIEQM